MVLNFVETVKTNERYLQEILSKQVTFEIKDSIDNNNFEDGNRPSDLMKTLPKKIEQQMMVFI